MEYIYRQLVEFAGDIIYQTDRKGNFTYCNRTALRLLGYSEAELLGHSYVELVHPEGRSHAVRFYGRQLIRRKTNSYYEFVCLARDGSEFWVGQNVQLLVENGEVYGFQAIARDITERKGLEDELAYEASHDTLTGLHNRRYLLEELQALLDGSRRQLGSAFSVCICDVDRFKAINDEYGHAAGDEVLKGVGSCLRANLRGSDVVGRVAGDEFAVLLPGTNESQAVVCLDRIRERIETMAFGTEEFIYSVTASFGVAQAEENMSAKDLLAAADFALYTAKKSGRNRTEVPTSILRKPFPDPGS